MVILVGQGSGWWGEGGGGWGSVIHLRIYERENISYGLSLCERDVRI